MILDFQTFTDFQKKNINIFTKNNINKNNKKYRLRLTKKFKML